MLRRWAPYAIAVAGAIAVTLVTGQLAASLRRTQAGAEVMATQSRALYELATAALRSSDATDALTLVSQQAAALPAVNRFALVAVDHGSAESVAGASLS